MRNYLLIFALIAAFTGCSGGGGSEISETETPPPATAQAVRILPLGDSITAAPGGEASYRYWLHQQLTAAGVVFDFVGSQHGVHDGSPKFPDFDQDHEGHWSRRADEILARTEEWTLAAQPDIVLIHIGTNDIFQGQSAESTAGEVGEIINTIRRVTPDARIVLSLVIPSTDRPERLADFNNLLPGVAASHSTAGNPILVVDQYTGFNARTDTVDGVHPNASGENKIAANFLAAILQLL